MITNHRPPGFFRRLIIWLNSPLRWKLFSILVKIFRVTKRIDNEIIRSADFETLDPKQEFSIAARGSEKFVVINTDKCLSGEFLNHMNQL
jgi:hypothetical protein